MADILVDRLRSVVVLEVDKRAMRSAERQVASFDKKVGRFRDSQGRFVRQSKGLTQSVTSLGSSIGSLALRFAGPAGLAVAVGGAVKASIDFESKFADVKKVVQGTPEQLKEIADSAVEMSKRFPIAAEGFAEILGAAGQAGIAREELSNFAEQAALVGVGFNISAGDAGTALAKLRTSLGLGTEDAVALAGAMNNVSNSLAATPPQILDVVRRVGALDKVVGATGEQTAALAGALIGAGAESNVAATGIKNFALALASGDRATKKQKKAFDDIGLSAKKVAEGALQDFEGTTLSVLKALRDNVPAAERAGVAVKLFGKESISAIGPLLNDLEPLEKAFGIVEDRQAGLNSLNKEFKTRSETTANQLQLLKNRAVAVGIEFGDKMQPALKGLLDLMNSPEAGSLGGQIFENLSVSLDVVIESLKTIALTLRDVIAALKPLVDGVKNAATNLLPQFSEAIAAVKQSFVDLGAALTQVFGEGSAELESFGELATNVLGTVVVSAVQAVADAMQILAQTVRQVGDAFESFREGKIIDGLKNIGKALITALLEPIRLVVRQLVGLADAVPGGKKLVPSALRQFGESGDVFQAQSVAKIDRELAAQDKARESFIDDELSRGAGSEGATFGGFTPGLTPFQAKRGGAPGETPAQARITQKQLRGSSGGKKARADAFQALIDSKIQERVKRAELLAGATGQNARAAGKQAKAEAQAFARDRNFAALGINPLDLIGPKAGMGVGAGQKPPIALTFIQIQPGAITGGINIQGSFEGSPTEIAGALQRLVVDEISQTTALRTTPQVD